MAIRKPKRRFLAFCRRCLGVGGECARAVGGGLYGNPKRFVGCVMDLCVSGNSLGFRADYYTFRNLVCAFFGVCGVGVRGYAETFAPFCRGGTWRGRFAWVKTSALRFRGTSGCFRGYMET